MRLVKVNAPQGKGKEVVRLAFDVGISQVSIQQAEVHHADGKRETKDMVDVQTATPTAKSFVDAVMSSPFFNRQEYSINVRQPRSIISHEETAKLTSPLAEPTIDIFEELWQFSHVTAGFVGRVSIAGMLLAYGMIESQLLIMIAGLLFLQYLPMILAISFGLKTQQWRLVGHAFFAFLAATALLVTSGAVVALLSNPPMQYNQHNPFWVSVLISLAVGIAAGLATADDVGRREMIGLAATAQIAILPVWFGVAFVFGFPPLDTASPTQRALGFVANVCTIIIAALGTYVLLGLRGAARRGLTKDRAAEA